MHLDFIRPGRPVENGYIESFNGKLRDECLNVEVFFNLADARRKLYVWRRDYNHQRPHSALDDRTPAEFAAACAAAAAMRVPELAPGHASRRQRHRRLQTPPVYGRPEPSGGAGGCSRAARRTASVERRPG